MNSTDTGVDPGVGIAIGGGVTLAKGFRAAGEHLGIRKNRKKRDVALIVSDVRAAAACCYTSNLVKGAPLLITRENIVDGYAQAMICNSGNANTCNANGIEIARGMCDLTAQYTGVKAQDVIVASTGVIGQPMTLLPFESGISRLAGSLTADPQGSLLAAEAIMTTDTVVKEASTSFLMGGVPCVLGGIAKGSGMINPNMATMLCFLTTDTAIAPPLLQQALSAVVPDTFNMLSIDGDTSTNDMVSILANGLAGNPILDNPNSDDYKVFVAALGTVCQDLCRLMARDGEGATKLITCQVTGAADRETARAGAKSVIRSTLVKAAIFGADANWGRVLCALGNSGAAVDIAKIDVDFASIAGTVAVCRQGTGIPFEESYARSILSEENIDINICLNCGIVSAMAWGCDLTYDYVRINGDYRT